MFANTEKAVVIIQQNKALLSDSDEQVFCEEKTLSEERSFSNILNLYEKKSSSEQISVSDVPSCIPWSPENQKRLLYRKGLYSPGSEDMCSKYIAQSDSTIFKHVYYNYPPIIDPGIEEALLKPDMPMIYPDDGQLLYLELCKEMNVCPVRLFHRNLLNIEINLSYYGADPKGINAMAKALQYNKYVQLFNLTDNFLNDDACYHLGQMLKCNDSIKTLILNGCRIGESGLHNLTHDLFRNRTLTLLDLGRNNLGDTGGAYFVMLFALGLSIKMLNLSHNKLGVKTALAITEALEWCNPLIQIDLSWNDFHHSSSTAKMIKHLSNSDVLQEVNLSFTSLEGLKVAQEIQHLLQIPELKILDLSHNRFRDEAVILMIAGLINAKKLITFNLSYNPISPKGAYDTLHVMTSPRVKLQNLLMDGIPVEKSFLILRDKILRKKSRNFVVTHDYVLQNWTIKEPDGRELLLKRAKFLYHNDIVLYLLRLNKELDSPMPLEMFTDQLSAKNMPLDKDFIEEFSKVFAGPGTGKMRTIDLKLVCDYIKRLWPEIKLLVSVPPLESTTVLESNPFLPPKT